ncbi:MAG: FkbM family methyltransferase [Actinomycetota bacterium]|nr:FkbM family methyltransferase [Actinomycetota bacterium]
MELRDLQGFTVVNLGSGGDAPFPLPPWARSSSTLVEVDAADRPAGSGDNFERRLTLSDIVAGSPGIRRFTTRSFVSVSGLLEPKPELVEKYALQEYFRVVDRKLVRTRTLPSMLDEHGIGHVDLLKTDLEGMDLEVLLACGGFLDRAYCVQCELRFEPFYEGEPVFHDALAALDGRGFDLLSLSTETWQPATPYRETLVHRRDGQTVWADCILIRRLAADDVVGRARQVVLLSGLAQRAVAAYVLGTVAERIPHQCRDLLTPLVRPVQPGDEDSPLRRLARAARGRLHTLAARDG